MHHGGSELHIRACAVQITPITLDDEEEEDLCVKTKQKTLTAHAHNTQHSVTHMPSPSNTYTFQRSRNAILAMLAKRSSSNDA